MAGWGDYTAAPKYVFKSKVEKQASDIFSDAITQDEEEKYTPQLRGSSLPICILQHAHALLDPHVRVQTARLEHYAVQGTVFHEMFQRKLTHSKKWGKYVFGDWECAKCETTYYKYQNRPTDYKTHVCPKCQNTGLRYRELEGKYKSKIGVHVDMVLKFPNKVWVWEFKTSGSFKLRDNALEYKNKHFHQSSTYPIVLEDVFGMKADRHFICYVNRDSPQHSKTSLRQHRFFPFKVDSNITERRREQLDKVVEAEKARIKYFKNPTLKNLRKLDDLRPCKSLEDYEEPLFGMKDKYESTESCPYIKKGVCGCFQTGKFSVAAKKLHKKIKESVNV